MMGCALGARCTVGQGMHSSHLQVVGCTAHLSSQHGTRAAGPAAPRLMQGQVSVAAWKAMAAEAVLVASHVFFSNRTTARCSMQGQVSVAASKAMAAEALSDRYLDLRALLKLLTKLTQVGSSAL